MPVAPCRRAAPHPILPAVWSRLAVRNDPCQSAPGKARSSRCPRRSYPSLDEGKVQEAPGYLGGRRAPALPLVGLGWSRRDTDQSLARRPSHQADVFTSGTRWAELRCRLFWCVLPSLHMRAFQLFHRRRRPLVARLYPQMVRLSM